MPEDWSRAEVQATVADYFDMLEQELRGQDFNKSAHRRNLSNLLNGRSDGAIERKHQNISAVLLELGFAYVSGYKLSYETTGQERLIEVKTTAFGPSTPFFVTRNEVDVSNDAGECFHLYRPFNFRRQPRLYSQQGPIGRAFSLDPSQFRATLI